MGCLNDMIRWDRIKPGMYIRGPQTFLNSLSPRAVQPETKQHLTYLPKPNAHLNFCISATNVIITLTVITTEFLFSINLPSHCVSIPNLCTPHTLYILPTNLFNFDAIFNAPMNASFLQAHAPIRAVFNEDTPINLPLPPLPNMLLKPIPNHGLCLSRLLCDT
jgi:hypothetical protein